MQNTIYNFYCLNTLSKHFYRLNPALNYGNFNFVHKSLKANVNMVLTNNKIIIFDTDLHYENNRFLETVMYSNQEKDSNIKYKLEIFDDMSLDSSIKFIKNFKETPKFNSYFWSNLTTENQEKLNTICKILNSMEKTKT